MKSRRYLRCIVIPLVAAAFLFACRESSSTPQGSEPDQPLATNGASCQDMPSARTIPGYDHPVHGESPVYVSLDRDDYRDPVVAEQTDGIYIPAVWYTGDDFHDPFTIRGERVDGDGELSFASRHTPDGSLQLFSGLQVDVDQPIEEFLTPQIIHTESGAHEYPSGIVVTSPGCYALQIDGPDFSNVTVIEALP